LLLYTEDTVMQDTETESGFLEKGRGGWVVGYTFGS
jgi:hypothetical protein